MHIEILLRIVADDNSVISDGEILHFDKGEDRLEVIGLSFNEAKAVLASIQGGVVTAQAASFLERHRSCDLCGSLLLSKGRDRTRFRTAFGTIALSSPRFHRCRCQPGAARTFSPLNLLLTERMAPELLYLEMRWVRHSPDPNTFRPVLSITTWTKPLAFFRAVATPRSMLRRENVV